MLPGMRKRLTLAEFLTSMDQLENELDRSTRAIERCIHHLTEIEGRMRREQLARAQTGWPAAAPGSTLTAPTAAHDPGRRLRNG